MTSGLQVDAWAAFVPNRKNLIQQIQQGVIKEVTNRKLPNLSITSGDMSISGKNVSMFGGESKYLFFKQMLGTSAEAILALRVAPRGADDLEISWRLIESDRRKSLFMGMSQGTLIALGIFLNLLGCPLLLVGVGGILMGIGVWMIGIGLGWWGVVRNKSLLTTDQMLDSRVLAQTVDYCLMRQLESLGVSATELKTIQMAQIQGIGQMSSEITAAQLL